MKLAFSKHPKGWSSRKKKFCVCEDSCPCCCCQVFDLTLPILPREDGDDTHLLCCSVLGNSCCVMCTSAPATAFQREVIFLPFLISIVCHKFKLADLITEICHGRLGYRREKGDLTELTMELMNANN